MKNKIILEIRAGAGGNEAAIFAGDLVRMYQKYAAKKGWRFLVLDSSAGQTGGYKTLVAELNGEGVYDVIKNESGVHRVQRVPATERSGRIHTSTATVAVLPEVEPQEVQINQNDLEVSFFRSSGPGGQNVNKVETAVRILHKPTGFVVSSQVERSQAQNRERAMNVLRAKLYETKKLEAEGELSSMRKEQIGSGERAEKIRTYNFPQDRVTDHRIGKSWGKIEDIIEGNLDKIMEALKGK